MKNSLGQKIREIPTKLQSRRDYLLPRLNKKFSSNFIYPRKFFKLEIGISNADIHKRRHTIFPHVFFPISPCIIRWSDEEKTWSIRNVVLQKKTEETNGKEAVKNVEIGGTMSILDAEK